MLNESTVAIMVVSIASLPTIIYLAIIKEDGSGLGIFGFTLIKLHRRLYKNGI